MAGALTDRVGRRPTLVASLLRTIARNVAGEQLG
jgi:hypothetical protein